MMKKILLSLLIVITAACSSYQAFRQGEEAESQENYDRAVAKYMEALSREPDNPRYKIYLERARLRASQYHFEKGKTLHAAGKYQAAILEYQMAVQMDPSNEFAQNELLKATRAYEEKHQALTDLEEMKQRALMQRGGPPLLNPRSKEPMSFSFPKPTEVQDIYQAMATAFGFNIIFDPQVKDKKITIELKELSPEKALEITMRAAGHFYKVIDETTIIIAPDTPQMRKEYEDLLIQTFYLSNAEVKDVTNMLRSIMGARHVATNEQLNAVIIRDTADKVNIAKKIIDANDKSKAEVIINVELLQVNSDFEKNFGTTISGGYQFGYAPEGGMQLGDIATAYNDFLQITVPGVAINMLKSASETEILAKPQLRISEGEKAKLHIGDKVPFQTAQMNYFNQAQTTGTSYYPSYTSYQYQDVGIKIDLEPRVHHNREVTLKLKVEVSSIGSYDPEKGIPPTVSTRTIDSVIRLKDGETNLLAGLIRSDVSKSKSGLPWIQDLPLLGAIFSSNYRHKTKTDLILTLTPQIIRMPNITEEDLIPVWVGTESNMTLRGSSPRIESGNEGPFDEDEDDKDESKEPKESTEPETADPSTRGRGHSRSLNRPGGAAGGPGGSKRPPRINQDAPNAPDSIPKFKLMESTQGLDDGRYRLVLNGSYGSDMRMASILMDLEGPLSWVEAEGINGVELVINEISEKQIRLDLILPRTDSSNIDLAYITLLPEGDGPKTLSILKGGVRDETDTLWPVAASGISIP